MKKRVYVITYNDSAFYGSVEFTNKSRKFIKKFLAKEIKENNINSSEAYRSNKEYLIGFKNIKCSQKGKMDIKM